MKKQSTEKWVLSLLLFLSCPIYANSSFTLENSIAYAIKHSPTLDQAHQSLRINTLKTKNRIAAFLPSLDYLSSTHQKSHQDDRTTINGTSSSINLTLSETLYNNGQNIIAYKRAKQAQAFTQLNFGDQHDQLIRTIALAYLSWSENKAFYAIQNTNVTLFEQQYQAANREYHQGLTTQEDVIRFKNQARAAKLALLDQQNLITQSRTQLLQDMGVPVTRKAYKTMQFKSIKLPTVTKKQLPKRTPSIKTQYEYRFNQIQIIINALDTQSAKRDYWPQVTLGASSGYGNTVVPGLISAWDNKKRFSWTVGLTLSYNLFDFGTRWHNIEIAAASGYETSDQLRENLLSIKQQIDNLMITLPTDFNMYQISLALLTSRKNNFVQLEKNYREGKLSYLDLETAITNLIGTKIQLVNTRYQLEKDFYRYHYFQGDIYAYANKA